MKSPEKFETLAIHAGQSPDPTTGAIMTPIYQTSTYWQESPGKHKGYEYSRTDNPTRAALEANLAALEGTKYGLSFASGCAAMTTIMMGYQAGDHIICCDDVYGGTYRLFTKVLSKFGLEFSFVDLTDLSKLDRHKKKQTKLVWIETPTNPLLKIIDIKQVAQWAKKNGCHSLVDNTFMSPYLQNPLALGADYVLHSTTKYIGGHSDVVGGFIGTTSEELFKLVKFNQNNLGAIPGPMDCFLSLRSTKTLAIRMERHCDNAKIIANWLNEHKQVEKVIYPGLSSHPQHQLASEQMKDFGGMISFVIRGGLEKARQTLEKVKIFSLAESLGGVESLIELPAIMTHASIPADIRKSLGIDDGLIRISVGLEHHEDLVADLDQAFRE
ncbi:MAG: cystathionine gamma-synthase [Deltaproteobacteria bacterium CG11_big_fil_rev_8_21_14_0_20_45_16]|nr:MAG: cystathionine gamma-synthase [Deltaproteobacteria bacterium CG11_big_fil_rev_8_21_14_0_20_45_16]